MKTPRKHDIVVVVSIVLLGLGVAGLIQIATKATTNPLTAAAMNGDVGKLEELRAAGFNLESTDPYRYDWTPLIAAAYCQQSNAVKYLINQGVDPNSRDRMGTSALQYAIRFEDIGTVQVLLESKTELKEDWSAISNRINRASNSNELRVLLEMHLK